MSESSVTVNLDMFLSRDTVSVDDFYSLRRCVRSNAEERQKIQEYLDNVEKKADNDIDKLKLGALNQALSRTDQAVQYFSDVKTPIATFFMAAIQAEQGELEPALKQFNVVEGKLGSDIRPAVNKVGVLRALGHLDEAIEIGQGLMEKFPNDPDILYEHAFNLEAARDTEKAVQLYEKVVNELDPSHPGSCFRLAYYADLYGDDDLAIELYSRISGRGSMFVSAMINLGLLFEDREDYNKALACYQDALEVEPTNARARLYAKNAEQSLDMYYDEAERKESERMEAILRTPISDFELSVRSRNCLSKMNIRYLGDLVKKTEQELLAYKNFGETSLKEIREMLSSKNLRLGMATDQDAIQKRRDRLRLSGSDEATLNKPISELDLSVRSRKCMQRLGIETLGDLIEKTEAELMATKNFGQTSLEEIKRKLAESSLSLRPMHGK